MSEPVIAARAGVAWGGSRFWQGVWRVADPKITLASASSLLLGICAAAYGGALDWPWLLPCVIGIFFLEAAKNASGELFDWDSGADQRVAEEDRSPFSGGKRVLVDGLWTRTQTAVVAAVFYALTAALGIWISTREPRVLPLGIAGALIAFFYHAPPLKLSYRGLGELAVFLCYGPFVCCGTYLVQRGQVPAAILHLSIPLGLMIAAFLFISEFPDARADAESGKRTLVVRLGKVAASRLFPLFPAVAFGYVLLLPALGLPSAVWLGLAGLPFAVRAAAILWKNPERTPPILPAQASTLFSFVALALGCGAGLLLSR